MAKRKKRKTKASRGAKCSWCNYVGKNERGMKRHARTAHPKESNAKWGPSKFTAKLRAKRKGKGKGKRSDLRTMDNLKLVGLRREIDLILSGRLKSLKTQLSQMQKAMR